MLALSERLRTVPQHTPLLTTAPTRRRRPAATIPIRPATSRYCAYVAYQDAVEVSAASSVASGRYAATAPSSRPGLSPPHNPAMPTTCLTGDRPRFGLAPGVSCRK